jgi:hypothetical protein
MSCGRTLAIVLLSMPVWGITYVILLPTRRAQTAEVLGRTCVLRSDDQDYYAGRALIHLELGNQAANSRIASVHYELAHRYTMASTRRLSGARSLTLLQGDNELAA